MIINYSNQKVIKDQNLKSIFLAGPTPRSGEIISWRKEALKALSELGFSGIVYVPEYSDFKSKFDYNDQVIWEREALMSSDVIVFWIPRKKIGMPGFTTNVEFGYYLDKKYCLLGHPVDAEEIKYLDWLYTLDTGRQSIVNLTELLKEAMDVCNSEK
jgi:nucleoside 2-deoxyribosyltransferase